MIVEHKSVKPEYGKNYAQGYLGFHGVSDSVISKGITWFTRWDRLSDIQVTHVFVVDGPNACIEADMRRGVVTSDLQTRFDDPNTKIFFRKPVDWNPDIGRRIAKEARSHLGEGYDKGLIAAHALGGTFLGRLLRIEKVFVDAFDDPDKWICSELAARSLDAQPEYEDKGVLETPDSAIHPQMLWDDEVVLKALRH